jgi:hypothetical protein
MEQTKGKHNLEYCLALASVYGVKPIEVEERHAKIFEHLESQFPDMSADWYHYETERRTKIYFKAYTGVLSK